MDSQFSATGFRRLQQLDTQRDGISANDLQAVDSDGNQQISEAEAAAAGFSPQDRPLLNRVLEAGQAEPHQPILMDTAQVHGWDEISMELINDSAAGFSASRRFDSHYLSRDMSDADKLQRLRERLGSDDESVASFVQFLDRENLLQHGRLEALVQRVGGPTAARIGQQIENYWQEPSRLSQQERKSLVKDLIKELGSPVTVTQGGKGTCAACAVQMKLLIENPIAYTEMALKLVEGQTVTSPGGEQIEVNDTWRLPGIRYGDQQQRTASDHRSLSSKALQNAFMNEGLTFASYESNEDYNNNEDALNIGQQAKLLTKVFGDHDFDPDYWARSASKMASLEDDLARGRSAVANFNGHAILVVGLDKSGEKDKVIFWSDDLQYEMDAEQFAQDLVSIVSIDDRGWDDRKLADGQRHLVSEDVHAQEREFKDSIGMKH